MSSGQTSWHLPAIGCPSTRFRDRPDRAVAHSRSTQMMPLPAIPSEKVDPTLRLKLSQASESEVLSLILLLDAGAEDSLPSFAQDGYPSRAEWQQALLAARRVHL